MSLSTATRGIHCLRLHLATSWPTFPYDHAPTSSLAKDTNDTTLEKLMEEKKKKKKWEKSTKFTRSRILPSKTIKNRIKKKENIKQISRLSREFFFKKRYPSLPLHSSRRGVKNLHNFASAWTSQPTIIIPPPAARVSSPAVNSNVLKNFSNVHKFGGMKVDLVFAVRHRVPNRSAWKRGRGGRSERERERKKERRRGERKRKTETSRLFITFTGSTVAPNGSGGSSLHNTGCEQTNGDRLDAKRRK